MARLPCKQTSPSQQPRANNFGNSRNCYWNMQTRHPAPPYVRNHQRQTDHTGEPIDDLLLIVLQRHTRCAPHPGWRSRRVFTFHDQPFSLHPFFFSTNSSSDEPGGKLDKNIKRHFEGARYLYRVSFFFFLLDEYLPRRHLRHELRSAHDPSRGLLY